MTEEEKKEDDAPKEEEKTEPGPDYDGVVAGKYQWDDDKTKKLSSEADSYPMGAAITKYGWSDGKKQVSVYVELEGLDDVPDDAITVEGGGEGKEKEVSLTIAAIGNPPRKRCLNLSGLLNEVDGVKLVRKKGKNTVSLKLNKKDEKTWWKLIDTNAGSGGGGFDDD